MTLQQQTLASVLALVLTSVALDAFVWHPMGLSSNGLAVLMLLQVIAVAGVGALLWRRQRALLASLPALLAQIEHWGHGHFTEHKQPEQPEWADLARTCNVTSVRLKGLLGERQRRLDELREHVDIDPVTHLYSRVHFDEQLQRCLEHGDRRIGGAVALLRVDDLIGLNRRFGRDHADDLLRAIAAAMRLRIPVLGERAFGARLRGADFVVLAPEVDAAAFAQWLTTLVKATEALRDSQYTDGRRTLWIGASTFGTGDTAEQILSRADAMLQVCESQQAPWKLTTPAQALHSLTASRWRQQIEDALATGRVSLATHDVLAPDGARVHQEACVRLRTLDGTELTGSDVVAPAVRTDRIAELDLRVIELALRQIAQTQRSLAVNVASTSLVRPSFLSRLAAMLEQSGAAAPQLCIEIDEVVLDHGLDNLGRLAAVLTPYGARLGIDHLQHRLTAIPGLGRLPVHYIKLDGRRLRQAGSGAGLRFVEIFCDLCRAEGIKPMACDVNDGVTLAAARKFPLQGWTGTAVHAGLPLSMDETLHGRA